MMIALPHTINELLDRANLRPEERLAYESRLEKIFNKMYKRALREGYDKGCEETSSLFEAMEDLDANA